jgi:copper(I)-binding protein
VCSSDLGGLHIMLIGLKQELKPGENAALTLTFDDGSTTTVNAPIKDITPPAGAGGMQHH